MFESIVLDSKNGHPCVPGYPIRGKIDRAFIKSGQRHEVSDAQREIEELGGNLDLFTSDMLLQIWGSGKVADATKLMATLWWGNVNRKNFNEVFSNDGITAIANNAPRIMTRLESLSAEKDFERFQTGLVALFEQLLSDDNFHIKGVGISFFTKFFHFWFQTHPLQSKKGFLPIICDRWLRKAVYADMVNNGKLLRVEIFKETDDEEIELNRPWAESYWKYVQYFNERAKQAGLIPFRLEQLLFLPCARNKAMEIISTEHKAFFLPDWVAGRYNASSQAAILFNMSKGESLLLEDDTAKLIGQVLKRSYYQPIQTADIAKETGFGEKDIHSFFEDLVLEQILVNNIPNKKGIQRMRREQYRRIHSFVAQRGGVNHLPSIFDSAEVAFRDKVSSQQIPTNVSFELTYGCNEKCIHCYNPLSPRSEVGVKKVATNELKKEDYFKILDDLTEMGVPQVLFTGGDPFVKKDFLEILNYAHQKKFAISIYSNGQSLSSNENLYQSVIDTYPYKIGLSIYSMKANEHEAITRVPGSLAKTKAIARRLHKDGVSLQIKCPIMKLNQEGYRKVNAFAEEVCGSPEFEVNITGSVDGDNYAVNNLRLSEAEMEVILIDPLMPLSTNREDTQRAMERTPEMQFCGAGIDAVNITPTGDIYPCMAFPLKCGNVREQSIRDIWEHSPELKATRELTYGMSDRCGKESYCKFCNRCIGQSFIEHGNPANASTDNCFIAQLRERIFKDKPVS